MRITTLIENLAYNRGLIAEHGLAFYIEGKHKKVIFDTGQTGNFLNNAQYLGINVSQVDTVILSHGHYDHTGGLYAFLKVNKKARVYVKEEAFQLKYHGTDKFIGTSYDHDLLNGRLEYVKRSMEIDNGIFIMPDIPVRNPLDLNFSNFKIRNGGGFVNDLFNDELFLCLVENNELSIVSSCSHRGITNILEAAVCHFDLPLNTVIGGFHIRDSKQEQLNIINLYLSRLAVKSVGVCHCTGVEKYAELHCQFREKTFYNCTGTTLELR
jgi:7,8-dihydropterin-6-yl-methyl-4-(beta-D-ribofuranosyl)aminobenzene 5'-phosphate synthase